MRAVRGLTDGRGADVSLEVIGLAATIEQAVKMTRRGGQVVLVGVPSRDVFLNIEVFADVLLAGAQDPGLLVRIVRSRSATSRAWSSATATAPSCSTSSCRAPSDSTTSTTPSPPWSAAKSPVP